MQICWDCWLTRPTKRMSTNFHRSTKRWNLIFSSQKEPSLLSKTEAQVLVVHISFCTRYISVHSQIISLHHGDLISRNGKTIRLQLSGPKDNRAIQFHTYLPKPQMLEQEMPRSISRCGITLKLAQRFQTQHIRLHQKFNETFGLTRGLRITSCNFNKTSVTTSETKGGRLCTTTSY